MQDYNQAFAHIAALTQGDPNQVIIDARAIHDVDKAVPAIPRRGTLPQLWSELCAWNNAGYGIFININQMDGLGREIANVQTIRCQVVDFDNINAQFNYERATQFNPAPAFAVQTSPGKFHAYWTVRQHANKDEFTLLQRKLRTLFDGDKSVIDPSRVLRLSGTLHQKRPNEPFLVNCWALAGYGNPVDLSIMSLALHSVNVTDGFGGRHPLGEPSLAAPSFEWAIRALQDCDPNSLNRDDWITITSAFKQSAWNFAPEQTLYDIWSQWCMQYVTEDGTKPTHQYLLKNWNSIRNTEVGWAAIERKIPSIHAMRIFGDKKAALEQQRPKPLSGDVPTQPPPMPAPQIPTGEFLTDAEQKEWFKGCIFIERMGEILTPNGRFMNTTKFNGTYGGKKFIIDGIGKQTTEAWQAATRSTLWTIPKADHIRFLPDKPYGELLKDALGRIGVNTFKPSIVDSRPGDISPFLRHIELILPNEIDRNILFTYLAHNIKYPGFKIPWAPLIQSEEGAGKGIIKRLMIHAFGLPYVYFPKAQELIDSGNKFNAWMRSKLFILVDEIKVDERRDMIEILKPMISEEQIEIQAKGIDQDIEDNFANWMFYSNYKDAIPVNKNSRRFSIFYSAIQSQQDLLERGMDERYFTGLYNWMRNEGAAYVTHWFQNYPIERGNIAMRAPTTTSTGDAVRQSRGPVESLILDAISDGIPGFRGGWVSSLAVHSRLKGLPVRAVSAKTLGTIMEGLGYSLIGRAVRPYFQENKDARSDLYNVDRNARLEDFGGLQGYEG